jgi:DNA-binding MarR family transcriptional regulator
MSKSVERFTQCFGSMMRVTAWVKSQSSYQGMDFTGLRLLDYLVSNGPSRLSDLADELAVDPAIITRQSQALVEGGFAERRVNPADARGTLLAINESGIELIRNHSVIRNAFFEEVFNGWSQDEINQFTNYVERFTSALNDKSAVALSRIKQNGRDSEQRAK